MYSIISTAYKGIVRQFVRMSYIFIGAPREGPRRCVTSGPSEFSFFKSGPGGLEGA